ncbi:TLC domain-containing protein 4-B isoform X1 [Entelurus aequoreus]|uniref:TLC domain-containing protein 4-B isoform X1 n=1 Tax=Entelurus aequoreus TaxID=161455 RepID=UPI002B1DA6EF|nr:TLC domain-containing protein 4-B isoform X1 [Entelurus aequoreus]
MEMRELTVVAGSFVSFQLLFSVASPLLSSAIAPSYGLLPPTKHTEWNSRLVSTVHALVVGLFCLYILWFDDAVNANPVWGDPTMVKLNVAITCGYLLYDTRRAPLLCQFSSHFRTIHAICEPKVVLRNTKIPPLARAGSNKRRGHGGGLLPGAHRRHAVLLAQRVRHVRHGGLRAPGLWRPGGLDLLLRGAGHPQHHLDVQDRPRLLQGVDRQEGPQGQGRRGGRRLLGKAKARQQPHGLKGNRGTHLGIWENSALLPELASGAGWESSGWNPDTGGLSFLTQSSTSLCSLSGLAFCCRTH